MELKPVFIIGAGRSGTKFLRDTLAASPEVARVPYDVGYIWRYGNEGLSHDEIDVQGVSEKSIKWMRRKIPQMIDRSVEKPDAHVLVEKSVPNSLRPLLLHRAFPEATFIHLVRDGRAVTESAMRLWQMPPERGYLMDKVRYFPWGNMRYGVWYIWNQISGLLRKKPPIWGPRYKGIEEDVGKDPLHIICAKQWYYCVSTAFRQLQEIPEEQVITVRYEDLMRDTYVLSDVCKRLNIAPEPIVERHLKTLRKGENEKWRKSLTPQEQQEIQAVFDELPESLKGFVFREKAV